METIDEILAEFAQGFILDEQVKEVKRFLENNNDSKD